jgi:hypothetical protein
MQAVSTNTARTPPRRSVDGKTVVAKSVMMFDDFEGFINLLGSSDDFAISLSLTFFCSSCCSDFRPALFRSS